MSAKVHPIPCTKMFSQFPYAFAHRITVTKISCFQPFEAHTHLGLRLFISQGL